MKLDKPRSMLGALEVRERRYKPMNSAQLFNMTLDIHYEMRTLQSTMDMTPEAAMESVAATKKEGNKPQKDILKLATLGMQYQDMMDEWQVRMGRAMPAQA